MPQQVGHTDKPLKTMADNIGHKCQSENVLSWLEQKDPNFYQKSKKAHKTLDRLC